MHGKSFFSLILICSLLSSAIYSQDFPADSTKEKLYGVAPIPIIFQTPETGFAGGAALTVFFREKGSSPDARPSTVMPTFIYTQKKQIILQLITEFWLNEETDHLTGNLTYLKFPDYFYGIGSKTLKENEESYTPRMIQVDAGYERKVSEGFYLGLKYHFTHGNIIKYEETGILIRGIIPGSSKSNVSGLGITASWDTRDHVYYASSGKWFKITAFKSDKSLGSDFNYNELNLDLRKYYMVAPSHIIALRGYFNFMSGNPPFYKLSLFGGDLLRGFYSGRYRDKNMIIFQAEYRRQLTRRFGFIIFAGSGDVAEKTGDFKPGKFKSAFGGGLRFALIPEEKINLRIDIGRAENSGSLYIALTEVF